MNPDSAKTPEKSNQETRHTPGPWTAEITGASPVKILATNNTDVVGYAVYGPRANVDHEHYGGVPVAEANARLIAAAPEMLAALKQVLPATKTLMDEMGKGPATNWKLVNDCLCAAGEAIAKAEGR